MGDKPGHNANQKRLRENLKSLGWYQRELAEWLTKIGEPVTRKQVEAWLSNVDSSNYRHCPAWPSLLMESRRGATVRRAWTKPEDDFLRDCYVKRGAAYCAEHLSRTVGAIHTHVGSIGLTSPDANRWQADQHDATLRRLHSRGLLIREVAAQMQINKNTVSKHAKRLGLKFNGTGRHFRKRQNDE